VESSCECDCGISGYIRCDLSSSAQIHRVCEQVQTLAETATLLPSLSHLRNSITVVILISPHLSCTLLPVFLLKIRRCFRNNFNLVDIQNGSPTLNEQDTKLQFRFNLNVTEYTTLGVRAEVFTAVTMNNAVFCDVTLL
jgi:hypothetical protein